MTGKYLRFEIKFHNLADNPTFRPYFIQKGAPLSDTISVYTNTAKVTASSKLTTNADYDDMNGTFGRSTWSI